MLAKMGDNSLLWLIETLKTLISTKYTGKFEIHFYKGGITSTIVNGTLKPGETLGIKIT